MILCVLKFSHPCKTPKLCPCSISKPKPAIRNLPFSNWISLYALELNFTKIIIKRAEMRNKRERKILFYSALSSQRSFHFHTFPFIIILVIHEWEKDFLLVLSVPLLLLMFVFVCVPKKKRFFFSLFSLVCLFYSFYVYNSLCAADGLEKRDKCRVSNNILHFIIRWWYRHKCEYIQRYFFKEGNWGSVW